MNPVKNIVIVDNQPLYIKGLKQMILEEIEDISVTPITNIAVALEQMNYRDTLFIINIQAIEASLKTYKEYLSKISSNLVIVMTASEKYHDRAIPPDVMCHDWFSKEDTEMKAIQSIKDLLNRREAGEEINLTNTQPSLTAKEEQALGQEQDLSSREILLLNYLSQGLTNKEIGKKLYLSEKTIKNNLTELYRKLHVTNRVEAAAYVINKLKRR